MGVKVEINEEQLKALNKLWFIYGNHGKKQSHSNHRFIQNIIQHNEDDRDFYLAADYSRYEKAGVDINTLKLTQECIDEVDKILNNERKS
jgi:hypothetical protein